MANMFKPVLNIHRSDYNKTFEYGKNYHSGTGLSNQLFGIINTIIECIMSDQKIIIFDGFHLDYFDGEMVELSKILNFEKITENLFDKYGKKFIFLDRNLIEFEFLSAKYGIEPLFTVDVSDKIFAAHPKNDIHFKNVSYNKFFECDPFAGIQKRLYIQCKLNDHPIQIVHGENQNFHYYNKYFSEDLFLHKRPECSFWIDKFNRDVFNSILDMIVFNSKFYDLVSSLNLNNMNVIHLRAENDMVVDQADKYFEGDRDKSRNLIYNKFRESIKYFPETDEPFFILTAEPELVEIIYGPEFNFKIYDYNEKFQHIKDIFGFSGREICGIVDLIIGIDYSNNFIGYFNVKHNVGSSFSYIVANRCKGKSILLHALYEDEIIH